MKFAWRRKTGAESDTDSSELSERVLQGAMIFSSSMLKGKFARLKASILGIEGSCLRSFTTRQGVVFIGSILKTPELPLPEPSLTTLPASHGKLADSRSRPLVKALMIAECERTFVNGKQKQI